jgi:hypothetical protein
MPTTMTTGMHEMDIATSEEAVSIRETDYIHDELPTMTTEMQDMEGATADETASASIGSTDWWKDKVKRNHFLVLFSLFGLLLCIALLVATPNPAPPPAVVWDDDLMHSEKRCQRTKFMPFRSACPKECNRTSTSSNNTEPEPLYRLHMAWYFGQPDVYEPHRTQDTAYQKGINFQCPDAYVESFRHASSELSAQVQANETIPKVVVKRQNWMHLSMSYLCCMTLEESYWAKEVMQQWILDNYPFDFTVKFDELQCWKERYNSITNIVVADEQSQRVLMQMNHDLRDKLRERGIPVLVNRESQMPFHMTLTGLSLGNQTESMAQEDNITTYLPATYDIVSNISKEMASHWTGKHRMRIRHVPQFTPAGYQHNQP